MQQIADWLEKLGMSEYAQRFAENDIDIDGSQRTDRSGLDRLGVSLGHRRRMLRAIRELGASPIAAVTERQYRADRSEPRPRTPPTSPSHRDVFGPCRLNGAIRAHGP